MPIISTRGGQSFLLLDATDSVIASARDITNLIGDALSAGATAAVVPVDSLHADFFQLRTGLAAELLQKAANYRIRLVVVGDISPYCAASKAFNDLVVESKRAAGYHFATTLDDANAWLESPGRRPGSSVASVQ